MNVILDKLLEELKVKGFEPKWYNWTDSYLTCIDLYNNIDQRITLEVCYTEEYEEEYEEEYVPHYARRGRGRMYASGSVMGRYHTDDYDYDDDDDDEYESKNHYASRGRMRVARYMRY